MASEDPTEVRVAHVEVSASNGVTVVAVTGVVDMLSAPNLTDIVTAALQDHPSALLIDLTGVDFLASAGLEVLVKAHRLAQPHTRIAVAADGPATSRPIKITQVDQFVPLYATTSDAIAALSAPAAD